VANVLVNYARPGSDGLPLSQTDECYLSDLGFGGKPSVWQTVVQQSLSGRQKP